MRLEIPKYQLAQLVKKQLSNFFELTDLESSIVDQYLTCTLLRCDRCFAPNPNKYFKRELETYFNPFHSVQYMIFLYYLSNTIAKNEPLNTILCDKIYYLNKTLNAVDLYYGVDMPEFFMAEHPVGAVIGRAKFGEGFLFYQCSTIGGYHSPDGSIAYPELGANVHLFANGGIIGKCKIGDNVNIGAGALVKNEDIPNNVNVFGQSPNLIIKPQHK